MMKFAAVHFGEDYTMSSMGDEYSFEAGKTYSLPLQKAEVMDRAGAPIARIDDWKDVADEDVADQFGEELEADEDAESPAEWLEARTVDEVHDDLEGFEGAEADIGFLEAAMDAAERTTAEEAIQERLDELRG